VICPSGAPNRFTIECNEEVRDRLWLCKAEYSWQTKEADGIRWKKWQRPAMSQYWFNTFNDSSTQFVRHANTIGFRVRIEVLWSPIESWCVVVLHYNLNYCNFLSAFPVWMPL
jgi:hypothetical protein